VIAANGPAFLVTQVQAPFDFNLANSQFCNFVFYPDVLKCDRTFIDVFNGKPNIDGLWNIKFIDEAFFNQSYNCTSPEIVQTKVVGTSDAITLTGPGTCTDGFSNFDLSGTGTVGGGQVSISNGTIGGCVGSLAMNGPVSWNGNIWSGTWSACGGFDFGTFEGIRKPTAEDINITVHNNTATGDLLGRTCWQVFYVAFGKNLPVDVVNDNNVVNAACDNALPHLENLTDAATAPGIIKITISPLLRLTYGDQWHVQQFQTPTGYLRDLTKRACDLSLGKCTFSVINLYNPTGDADGDGCTNARERLTATGDQIRGGRRNPKNFWDFADMPAPTRDKKIDIRDVSAVINRYRTNDNNGTAMPINRNTDPLSVPPAMGYHPAFDRTLKAGLFSWSSGPPNGRIGIDDVSNVINQYRHNCN